jgi:spore coat protein CotH
MFGGFGGPARFSGRAEEQARPPRGASAFVYVDGKTGAAQLFDYVNAPTRSGHPGHKVLFHKDRPFNQMSAVSLVFEGSERQLMAEALAYDVYRRAGNAAPLTEFLRLYVNGRLQGDHLAVERPNKGFLRRNKVDDHGNLYKILWFGNGVVGQHAKKTHLSGGHDDIIALVDLLGRTNGDPDAQWAAIQKNFDVDQAATHFAVNMVLSHWDGFFNNYYAYHDTKRDKWQMYPWDHDKSWGITDGMGTRPVMNIPLTFGMNDARGGRGGGGFGGGGGPFGGNTEWWRPPGYFSGPLLANPHFRKVFLARVRSILDDVYTEQIYVPFIDDLVRRLGEDAALRAPNDGGSAAAAKREWARSGEFFKTHLRGRREFLLKQKELVNAGK